MRWRGLCRSCEMNERPKVGIEVLKPADKRRGVPIVTPCASRLVGRAGPPLSRARAQQSSISKLDTDSPTCPSGVLTRESTGTYTQNPRRQLSPARAELSPDHAAELRNLAFDFVDTKLLTTITNTISIKFTIKIDEYDRGTCRGRRPEGAQCNH